MLRMTHAPAGHSLDLRGARRLFVAANFVFLPVDVFARTDGL
jgi:hypothetical protein